MHTTLVPAYGRDYRTAKAVREDWNDGKDFLIFDMSSPDDGRYVNKPQVPGRMFNIRFDRKTKLVVVKG